MNAVKHSGGLGVPLAKPRVALSAASPRFAAGFPLQSLTRSPEARVLISVVLFLLCFAPISGSAQTATVFQPVVFDNLSNLRIQDVVAMEKQLGSTDQTPDHLITISEGLYPNKNGFTLATPNMYLRTKKGFFDLSVDYYYSTTDSSVKTVLYEWKKLPEGDDMQSRLAYFMESEKPENKAKLYAHAQEQYDSLQVELNKRLGPPTETEVGTDRSNFRDSFKWTRPAGMNAYLIMFGNEGYREVRLVLYEN